LSGKISRGLNIAGAARKWLWLGLVMFQLAAIAGGSPWQRVVVIGASASSGFVLSEPFGGTNTDQCRLSYYLDAAIAVPHEPLKNLSSAMLFMSPEAIATQEIEAATNNQPTLVIAVDFMFWFCYGQGRNDVERAQRFEYGLKLLERLPCPLIVGDIPDASAATNSGIISSAQVPSETARAAANKRLREWAAHRAGVTVVPLDQFMKSVVANTAIRSPHVFVPAGKTSILLQNDRLHPNPHGAAILALGILDELVAGQATFSANEVRWDFDEVLKHGQAAALPRGKD
jgi:hypothetical protein